MARRILDDHGLHEVRVEPAQGGALSDHYDPKANVVRLSQDIYTHSSIASVAVAAHECGHAIQHAENYGFIALRNSILPFAMVSSQLSWIVLIAGLLFSSTGLFYTGIIMLGCVALFQLVTPPVELDASKRAMALVSRGRLCRTGRTQRCESDAERRGVHLYRVADFLGALQILRSLLIFNRNRD